MRTSCAVVLGSWYDLGSLPNIDFWWARQKQQQTWKRCKIDLYNYRQMKRTTNSPEASDDPQRCVTWSSWGFSFWLSSNTTALAKPESNFRNTECCSFCVGLMQSSGVFSYIFFANHCLPALNIYLQKSSSHTFNFGTACGGPAYLVTRQSVCLRVESPVLCSTSATARKQPANSFTRNQMNEFHVFQALICHSCSF